MNGIGVFATAGKSSRTNASASHGGKRPSATRSQVPGGKRTSFAIRASCGSLPFRKYAVSSALPGTARAPPRPLSNVRGCCDTQVLECKTVSTHCECKPRRGVRWLTKKSGVRRQFYPMVQDTLQIRRVDGFAQVVVHSGREAALAVARHR